LNHNLSVIFKLLFCFSTVCRQCGSQRLQLYCQIAGMQHGERTRNVRELRNNRNCAAYTHDSSTLREKEKKITVVYNTPGLPARQKHFHCTLGSANVPTTRTQICTEQ